MTKCGVTTSNAQYLQILVVADGDPVWLSDAPLYLVYLSFGSCIRQDWVLDCARDLLNIPDESLMVVSSGANVTGRMWSPGYAVHTSSMIVQPCHRCARHSHVQNYNFTRIHGYGGEVVWILLV